MLKQSKAPVGFPESRKGDFSSKHKGFDPIIVANPLTGKLDLEIFAEMVKG